jgi:tetratricopeptide (TPR) repeat protein
MTEIHPTPEALERFVLGQLAAPEMREIARHLLTGCRQCHEATGSLWDSSDDADDLLDLALESAGDEELPEPGYDEVLDRVFERMASAEAVVVEQRAAGCRLFDELMQIPAERRHLLVSNSQRFRHRMLCERLLEASYDVGFEDPAEAVDVAQLATLVADRLRPEECGGQECLYSLRARAWAHLGNAFRISLDLASAERAFARAEALLDEGGVALVDRGRVLDLLASLRKDQRRFAEALQLLDRVAALHKRLGQWSLLGRTFLQKANVCGEAGDGESEIRLLRRALDLIDPQADPRVFLAARHNLINALHESGRSREAFALLFHTRPLYLKAGDRMNLLRLRWLEGAVALGLQRGEQAEVAFREVREGFIELGLDYDAALVSLDLAGAYAEQGRLTDVRRVAEETLSIFQARNTHQEAMAALLALCSAARLDQAGVELVREVAGFLKRARTNPDLPFVSTAGNPTVHG